MIVRTDASDNWLIIPLESGFKRFSSTTRPSQNVPFKCNQTGQIKALLITYREKSIHAPVLLVALFEVCGWIVFQQGDEPVLWHENLVWYTLPKPRHGLTALKLPTSRGFEFRKNTLNSTIETRRDGLPVSCLQSDWIISGDPLQKKWSWSWPILLHKIAIRCNVELNGNWRTIPTSTFGKLRNVTDEVLSEKFETIISPKSLLWCLPFRWNRKCQNQLCLHLKEST